MPDIELTYNQAAVDALVKEAVERERDRCAAIAETHVPKRDWGRRQTTSQYIASINRDIAATIRSTPPEGEK